MSLSSNEIIKWRMYKYVVDFVLHTEWGGGEICVLRGANS